MTLVNLTDAIAGVPVTGALTMVTVYSLEGIAAVIEVGAQRGEPVGLLISDAAFRSPVGLGLMSAAVGMAERVHGAVCVQLDHCSDLAQIAMALALGATAVMADGSRLEKSRNAALCASAVELAAPYGADVEAELGRLGGDEERTSSDVAHGNTSPADVNEFVRESGCACLAVAIGNRHGRYPAPPELDLELLAEIDALAGVPLALHGVSGIPTEQLHGALAAGARKVNVNTEIRAAAFEAMQDGVRQHRPNLDWMGLSTDVRETLTHVTAQVLSRVQ